jgi:nucleotide-binding universal stress UspA family protein
LAVSDTPRSGHQDLGERLTALRNVLRVVEMPWLPRPNPFDQDAGGFSGHRGYRILLATDGSKDAELAANAALDLSKKLDSELHVVYVEPMPERHSAPMRFAVDLPPEVVRSVEQEANAKLEKLLEKLRQEEGAEVGEAHARVGLPAAEILALAEELGVGLIVMGSRGLGGIRRALLGSVSDSVVRHAHCPVMVVRREEEGL